MIEGALVLLLGLVLGFLAGRRQRRPKSVAPEITQPICGCEHHLSQHDSKGRCHAQVRQAKYWNLQGRPADFRYVNCTCQQYVGPQVMMDLIAPPELLYDGIVKQVPAATGQPSMTKPTDNPTRP
jgi:hypothetical protein